MTLFRKNRRLILAASVALLCAAVAPSSQADSGTWIGGTSNWTTNGNWTGAAFPNGAAEVATFDNTALSFTPTLTNSAIALGAVTISAGAPAFTVTLNGPAAATQISFEGAGVVNNSGILQNFVATGSAGNPAGFTFNNSASAGTQTRYTLNADSRVLFTDTSSGGTAAFVVNTGGSFDISAHTAPTFSVGSIAGGGSFFLGSKALTVGADNTNTTVSGVIQDGGLGAGVGGSLIKTGTGTLTLSGANTYTGGTTLENGGLFVNNSNALGTGALTVTSTGGTTTLGTSVNGLTLANTIELQGNLSIASNMAVGQTFTLAGNIDLNGANRTITGTSAFAQIAFNGGIGMIGEGAGVTFSTTLPAGSYVAFLMNVPNNYTGLTTVTQGAFIVFQGAAANGALKGNVVVETGGVLDYLGGNSEQIADSATVTVNSAGNSASGTAFGGFDLFTATGTETIGTLLGNASGTVWLNSATLAVGAGDFSGVISDGTHGNTGGKLTKYGPGVLILRGANTYTGATTISGGILRAGAANTFSSASTITVNAGATLSLNNFNQTTGGLAGAGSVTLGSGFLATGVNNASTAFSGTITGTGGLTKAGTGTLTLSGANTYAGVTTVLAGVLGAGAANTFSSASSMVVDQNGTLTLNNFNQTIGELSNGNSGGGVVNLGTATLTTGGPLNSTFSGTINGTGGLTKVGTGFLTLTGTTNYSGATAVNGGGLAVAGALTGPVTVNNAQFNLNATGTVTRGAGVTGVAANASSFVNNAGAITVGNNSTGLSAVTNNTLTNTGSITGGAIGSVGVLLSGAGNVLTNETGATITATTGILLTNPTGTNTIINRGTITGTGGIAINNSVSTGGMNLTNLGTINGAILYGSGNDTLTFATGFGTTSADGGAGVDTLRLVGARSDTLNITQITNFEYLVKLGGGTWTLTGDGFFPGGTSIQDGNLYVQGTLNSPVSVMHEGLLGGTGLIGGHVTNFGVVNPGTGPGTATSIGKLTIRGDYAQAKSGLLVIEVAGKRPGQYDVLAIEGRAQLDGALRIERVGRSPRLKVGDRLAFLTASNGVDGKFSDVRNSLTSETMVLPEVVYEDNAVVIAGVQGSYKDFADQKNLTPNQRAAAEAVDEAAFGRKAGDNKMVAYLNERTLDKLPRDLDRVAPEEIAAVFRMGVTMADTQARNIQQHTEEIRLTNRRPLRAPTPPVNGAAGAVGNEEVSAKNVVRSEPEDRWGSFFTGSGQVARVGRTDNARDYEFETGGLTVGVDYQVTPNLVVGLSAGYNNMTAHLDGDGRISANGGRLGVYGTYFKDGFHANAAVAGGLHSYESSREGLGGMARGKTEGQEWSALVGGGYEWSEKAFRLGPTVAVQYTYMELDAFTERGSLAPLNVSGQHEESFRSTAGMKAAYEWNLGGVLIRPEMLLAWQHEFGERSFTLDSSLASGAGGVFTVKDTGVGRDGLLLSGGVSVLWQGGTVMYLRYDGDLLRKEYESHNLSGGVRVTF